MSSIGFWNCRGVRKKATSLYAKEFIRENDVFFLGLSETKLMLIDNKLVEEIFGDGWDFFFVPSDGLSGGILLIWRNDIAKFNIVEASSQFAVGDLEVINKGCWRVATVYGSKDVYKRRHLWNYLEKVLVKNTPMVIGGDFNCLFSKEEKKGGRKFSLNMGSKEMKAFITCNDLHEVTSSGPKFTWCNNKIGAERILEKLDRCMVNSAAFNSSHRLLIKNLARLASDHCPIILNLLKFIPHSKTLKFEEVWTSIPAATNIVLSSWKKNAKGDPAQILNQKMKRVLRDLHYWSRAKFKDINLAKDNLQKEIITLQEKEGGGVEFTSEEQWRLKACMEELSILLNRINTIWKQRAKIKWLSDGDSNTRFYHAFANARRNSNYIHSIKSMQGDLVEDQEGIEEILFQFFNSKWKERSCVLLGWPLLNSVLVKEDKEYLGRKFSIEELEKVIKELGSNISPGQDGGKSIGISVSARSPKVSHLVYADDILVFSEAKLESINLVKKIIMEFCDWTGQKVNFQKYGILFGKHVNKRKRRKICNIMEFKELQEFNYLGTKMALRRMKGSDFQFILDNALKKIGMWGSKLLSMAGKLNLINYVLLALPTFHTTLSLVPKRILLEIEKACRKFIWSKGNGEKGLHYISWDTLCKPKKVGGMGINSCSKKEGPLRVKLTWRYYYATDSLMLKVLYPKYGHIMLEDSSRRTGSTAYKLIKNGGKFLKPIIRWEIGKGNLINVVKDTWIYDKSLLKWPTFTHYLLEDNYMVEDFIKDGRWDVQELQKFFGAELKEIIRNVHFNESKEDRMELIHKFSGKSLTSLACEVSKNCYADGYLWNWLDKIKLIPRVRLFWWRLLNEVIPTNKFLCYRRLQEFDNCPRGCGITENTEHIISGCGNLIKTVEVLNSWGFGIPRFSSLENCLNWLKIQNSWMKSLYCNMVFHSWKSRNLWVHERKSLSPLYIASNAICFTAVSKSSLWSFSGIEGINQPSRLFNNWYPPPPDWINVNIDASVHNSYKAGLGGVCRDYRGRFLLAFGKNCVHWDSGQMELLAILFLKDYISDWMKEYKGLIIEGDNKNVINFIKDKVDK
ncbi:hypothetical protein KFK09_008621 [Dendrobium nobile]|uniref:Uncharacterized protein n=1 Tax=Dendrobium nobile TaxID=94219 RepID=A0A8T3BQF8_DENNO|nr:hypothetical protein KFK09_008621 [Dendrobium nobile]